MVLLCAEQLETDSSSFKFKRFLDRHEIKYFIFCLSKNVSLHFKIMSLYLLTKNCLLYCSDFVMLK